MSDYLPKWACEKLEAMGCVSENFMSCHGGDESDYSFKHPIKIIRCWARCNMIGKHTMRFTPYDFVGTSEQAKKNAEILWGTNITPDPFHTIMIWNSSYEYHRHTCIESDNAVEYICSFLKGDE